jgi:hypothetical protein
MSDMVDIFRQREESNLLCNDVANANLMTYRNMLKKRGLTNRVEQSWIIKEVNRIYEFIPTTVNEVGAKGISVYGQIVDSHLHKINVEPMCCFFHIQFKFK